MTRTRVQIVDKGSHYVVRFRDHDRGIFDTSQGAADWARLNGLEIVWPLPAEMTNPHGTHCDCYHCENAREAVRYAADTCPD